MRLRPRACLAILLGSLACKAAEDTGAGEDLGWALPEMDLGTPLAQGTGFAFEHNDDGWFAAQHIVPRLEWEYPVVTIPLYLWNEVAYGENIADPGSCPYLNTHDGTDTWVSNCRSQDGYIWAGEFAKTAWDDEFGRWTRYDMDLEITADVDRPQFEQLKLEGVVYTVVGDGDELQLGAQVNAIAGIDGYWEKRSVVDDKEISWDSWALTGRVETDGGGRTTLEGQAELGALGGLSFHSDGLDKVDTCAAEPDGKMVLSGATEITLAFDAKDTCNFCADLQIDGEFKGQSCGQVY